MIPSVICLFVLFLLVGLIRSKYRQDLLRLKREHWNRYLTERRYNFDSGWEKGYEFGRAIDKVSLDVALDYLREGDLEMDEVKDRISVLVGRQIQKIEHKCALFNAAMVNSGNDPVVNKVAFYTTMIQIIKDMPSQDPEAAEVERHTVKYLIKVRNAATREIVEKYDTIDV